MHVDGVIMEWRRWTWIRFGGKVKFVVFKSNGGLLDIREAVIRGLNARKGWMENLLCVEYSGEATNKHLQFKIRLLFHKILFHFTSAF